MAKTQIAKQAAISKGPSKEAKQIQKLQEDKKALEAQLRESRNEVRVLKKTVSEEKKCREEEKKQFERRLRDLEDGQERYVDIAVNQVMLENKNEMKSLVDKSNVNYQRWGQAIEDLTRVSKVMVDYSNKFMDDFTQYLRLPAEANTVAFKNYLLELRKVFNNSSNVWQETEVFVRKFKDLALTGSPLCKTCTTECERHPVNIDLAHLPNTPPSSCQICCFKFSEIPGRVPRILQCGHSICERCIDNMKAGTRVTCPFDRKETLVPLSKAFYLPKNFSVLEIISTMPVEEEDEPVEEREEEDVIVLN